MPTDDKGFKYTPIKTLGDVTTNSTFYEDVYVPKQNLVGNIDEGWNLITSQLNLERLALVKDRSLAFVVARQNEFHPVPVH